MRLPEDTIKKGILHPEPLVRDAAAHYFAMSLRAFKARTLMTLRAGLALNICSCLVKG